MVDHINFKIPYFRFSNYTLFKISNVKYTFILLFFIQVCNFNMHSQTKYYIKDKEGFDFILNVNVDGNQIIGFTRENALLDYTSKFNFQLIKAASSLKYPEIIRFSATLIDCNFEGVYDQLFSSYKIVGKINTDSISYSLYKNEEFYKSYNGKKITNFIKKDYVKLALKVVEITEDNIYDPNIIQTKKWQEYKTKIIKSASNTIDDLEFQIGFFALARNIGFSHYYLIKNAASTDTKKEIPSLKEIDDKTVILTISSFFEKNENIVPLIDTIKQKSYQNLVIDLRDNPGGNFESASLLANFLTDKVFISGFFPNRRWYEEYNRLPGKDDIDKFSLVNGIDSTQNQSKYGFCIMTKGSVEKFGGNVFLLVNKKTGSTAEALAIGAKEYKLAKIVGEKTSGGLLSAKRFQVDEDIILIVPINDFISYNGYRVDQKGVEPDIKTKKGKELEQVLEIIKNNNF